MLKAAAAESLETGGYSRDLLLLAYYSVWVNFVGVAPMRKPKEEGRVVCGERI